MIQSVDHINIVVSDLERSVRFYTEVLGLRETKRAELRGAWIEKIVGLQGVVAQVAYVEAAGPGPRIELLEYRSPQGESLPQNAFPNTRGLRHIAFRVADMDLILTRLREAGAAVLSEPVTVPDQIIRHERGQKTLCYFHDPDGVILELAEYR